MRAFVVIATKGRASTVHRLLDYIQRQTRAPDMTVVVGAEPADLNGLSAHSLIISRKAFAAVSPKTGLPAQRNFGLELLEQGGNWTESCGPFFCVYFDDDYRPADDWLEKAELRFSQGDVVGLTGMVLADGVKRGGFKEEDAEMFLDGTRAALPHSAYGPVEKETDSAYGCNMAFTDVVSRRIRFDENLPLYGWLEDRDYAGLASQAGRLIYYPECRGVHLGVQSARTSGLRFGYSQIANPVYMMKKGTIGRMSCLRFVLLALLANVMRSFQPQRSVQARSRLRGSLRALKDLAASRLHPRRILDTDFSAPSE